MKEELDTLYKTQTWNMVDLQASKSGICWKWVYKIKSHLDGSIDYCKACLVAKGFTLEYGIEFEETFA